MSVAGAWRWFRRLPPAWRAVPAVAWAAMIWWLSSQPDPPGAGTFDFAHADKLAHAFLFGTLALLLRAAGVGPWRAILLATLYGVVDEIHQSTVPNRTPEVADVVADALGAAVAVGLVEAVRVRFPAFGANRR